MLPPCTEHIAGNKEVPPLGTLVRRTGDTKTITTEDPRNGACQNFMTWVSLTSTQCVQRVATSVLPYLGRVIGLHLRFAKEYSPARLRFSFQLLVEVLLHVGKLNCEMF